MAGGSALAGAMKVVAAVAVGAAAAGSVALASDDGRVAATVAEVVDGDTIDVTVDGRTTRVRLLDVDTPETVDPDEPVQCLGPEATDLLRGLLPVGTEVVLEHDAERFDGYDRELAGVFVGDTLVNAEMARAGLGVAIAIGENTRFHDEVLAAEREARAAQRGLYSTEPACTVPAQVAQLESTAATLAGETPAGGSGVAPFDAHAADLADLAGEATALLTAVRGDRSRFPLLPFTVREVSGFEARVDGVSRRLSEARRDNTSDRSAEQERLRAEEQRRAGEEAARRAAEEAAREAAEEAARRVAEAEAAQRAAEAQRPSSSSGSSGSSRSSSSGSTPSGGSSSGSGSSSGGSGGADTYTGCRAYGSGGSSVDDRGRPYTRIDCVTKQPIG